MNKEILPDDKIDYRISTKILIRDTKTGENLLLRRGEVERDKIVEDLG
jgi:hypothetical protein